MASIGPVMSRITLLASLLGSAIATTSTWTFNFGTFGQNEPVIIYGSGFDLEAKIDIDLYPSEQDPSLSNLINLEDCFDSQQLTFENSTEFLPLTQNGYFYITCNTDPNK